MGSCPRQVFEVFSLSSPTYSNVSQRFVTMSCSRLKEISGIHASACYEYYAHVSNSPRRSCEQIGADVDREGPVLIVTAKIQRPQGASRLRRGPVLLQYPRVSLLSAPKACESRSRNFYRCPIAMPRARSTNWFTKLLCVSYTQPRNVWDQHVETLALILHPKQVCRRNAFKASASICQVGWSFIFETENNWWTKAICWEPSPYMEIKRTYQEEDQHR